MFRFAILKTVKQDRLKIVLEYDEKLLHERLRRMVQENIAVLGKIEERMFQINVEQLLERLQIRVKENLIATESFFKHRWNKKEISESIDKAYNDLIYEFLESIMADKFNREEIDKSVDKALKGLVHEIREETIKLP
jgi:hypothetical protein